MYFYFRLGQIRKEMKAILKNLPEDKLQKISLSLAQYEVAKKDEDEEIEWLDDMYDVAKVEFQINQVVVFALRDEAETNLIAFFEKVVSLASKDHRSPPAPLMQYMSLIFTLPADLLPQDLAPSLTKQHFTQYNRHLLPVDREIHSPPPRV